MPQFDLYSFFNQSIWLPLFIFLFLIFVLQFLLPALLTIIFYRYNYLNYIKFFQINKFNLDYNITNLINLKKNTFFNEFIKLFFKN